MSLCLGAGWFFGNIPIIKNNFSLVTIGIVFVSVLPMLFELISHRRGSVVPVAGSGGGRLVVTLTHLAVG